MTTANGSLLTYSSGYEVRQFYMSATTNNLYGFIGKVDPWADDLNPPLPSQTQYLNKEVSKNMFAAKQILASDIAPVIPRNDWTAGTVYSYYIDTTETFVYDTNGIINSNFYVRNSYDQIFKCVWNNNGNPSTVEPQLYPGYTDPYETIALSDGYKWIYITTIDKGLKQKFFDINWMPLSLNYTVPSSLSLGGLGKLDAINVTNGGNNYTNGFTTTNITITGDGSGAIAYANVYSNTVQDIIITNSGNNYTYCNVSIVPATGYSGNGANAFVVISPIGGNGLDPVAELGCNHVMISLEMNGNDEGIVLSNTSYRQMGIILNPLMNDGSSPTNATYNTSDLAYVSIGTGNYNVGETVYQGTSLNNSTFSGLVAGFDQFNNIISIINISGTYNIGEILTGNLSGTSRILLNYDTPSFLPDSGYILYLENRSPVSRTLQDNEQFRIVLGF